MDYTNSALVKKLLNGLSFEITSLKTEISRFNNEINKLRLESEQFALESQEQPIPFFDFTTSRNISVQGDGTQTVYAFTLANIPKAIFTKALGDAGGDVTTFNGGTKPEQPEGVNVAIAAIGKELFYTQTQFTAIDGTVIPANHFFTSDSQKFEDLGDEITELGFDLGGETFAKDTKLPLKINGELVYVTNKVVKDIRLPANKVAPWGVELSQPIAGCQYVRVLSDAPTA